MMAPRIDEPALTRARALSNPLPASPEMIEQGGALYQGRGGCAGCHGDGGRGNGPLAQGLDPRPRDFRPGGFWRHRSEGEIFWVIKHGVAGSAMPAFDGVLADEDIWSLVHYLRGFAAGPQQRMEAGCPRR